MQLSIYFRLLRWAGPWEHRRKLFEWGSCFGFRCGLFKTRNPAGGKEHGEVLWQLKLKFSTLWQGYILKLSTSGGTVLSTSGGPRSHWASRWRLTHPPTQGSAHLLQRTRAAPLRARVFHHVYSSLYIIHRTYIFIPVSREVAGKWHHTTIQHIYNSEWPT